MVKLILQNGAEVDGLNGRKVTPLFHSVMSLHWEKPGRNAMEISLLLIENGGPNLHCRIIAGAANNQLATPQDRDLLGQHGILYAPDYVINAGGVINLSCEFAPNGYNESEARQRTQKIAHNLDTVFQMAEETNSSTATAADRLAEQRIAEGGENSP